MECYLKSSGISEIFLHRKSGYDDELFGFLSCCCCCVVFGFVSQFCAELRY